MTPVPMPESGPRVLGFGKHAEIAAQVQDKLREAGIRSTNFALTDDPEGDATLIEHLRADDYEAVTFGAFITSQQPEAPPTLEKTVWFNRVVNLVHEHAPAAKFIFVAGPADALPAIKRVLG
jgi:hypothetical protein